MRRNSRFNVAQFAHQFFIDMQAACGIYNDGIVIHAVCFSHCFFGNFHRRYLVTKRKYRNIKLRAQNFQLFYSCRAVNVGRNQHGVLAFFAQHIGKFAGRGGFTCALQAYQHNNRRRFRRNCKFALCAAKQFGKFFINNFYNLLAGC